MAKVLKVDSTSKTTTIRIQNYSNSKLNLIASSGFLERHVNNFRTLLTMFFNPVETS